MLPHSRFPSSHFTVLAADYGGIETWEDEDAPGSYSHRFPTSSSSTHKNSLEMKCWVQWTCIEKETIILETLDRHIMLLQLNIKTNRKFRILPKCLEPNLKHSCRLNNLAIAHSKQLLSFASLHYLFLVWCTFFIHSSCFYKYNIIWIIWLCLCSMDVL